MATTTRGSNIRRDDIFGRPLKHQSYEMLVTTNDAIKERSKEFKLTAGELFEVMLACADWDKITPAAKELRARKEQARAAALEAKRQAEPPAASQLAKKLKEMTPAQLAKVKAMIANV